jgi:hypothetical protein
VKSLPAIQALCGISYFLSGGQHNTLLAGPGWHPAHSRQVPGDGGGAVSGIYEDMRHRKLFEMCST